MGYNFKKCNLPYSVVLHVKKFSLNNILFHASGCKSVSNVGYLSVKLNLLKMDIFCIQHDLQKVITHSDLCLDCLPLLTSSVHAIFVTVETISAGYELGANEIDAILMPHSDRETIST